MKTVPGLSEVDSEKLKVKSRSRSKGGDKKMEPETNPAGEGPAVVSGKKSRGSFDGGVKELWQRFASKHHQKPWFRLETLLVAGAIITGTLSAALSEANRSAASDDIHKKYKLVSILTAAKDLPIGVVLEPNTLVENDALAASVTNNMVPGPESANVIGRRLTMELKKGDPVLLTAVEGVGSTDGFASKIPAGKRLVTLQIKDKVAGNGWVKPNDHVDVIANLDLPARGHTSFTLLDDITLVSVGKATVWEDGKSSAGAEIGFFVTPEEVEFVNFAQERGEFSLSLRNPKDVKQRTFKGSEIGSAGVDMTKFLDHASVQGASGGGDLAIYVKGKKEEEAK